MAGNEVTSKNFDTQLDLSPLERKKRLLNAIMAASQKAGDPTVDAGAIKAVNWGEPLGKLISAFAAGKQLDDIDKQEKQIGEKVQKQRGEGISQFFNTVRDDPGTTPTTPNDDEGNAMPTGAHKGDLLKALTQAIAHPDPTVQAIGTKGMEEYNKTQAGGMPTTMGLIKEVDKLNPNSPILQDQPFSAMPKTTVQDGVASTVGIGSNNQPVVQSAPTETFTTEKGGPGLPPASVSDVTGRAHGLQGGNMSPPEKSLGTELASQGAKDLITRLSASYGKVVPAINDVQYFGDAFKLLDGAHTGKPWSSVDLSIQKAAAAMIPGFDPNGTIPSTEMVATIMSAKALQLLQSLRPASDPDRVYAEKLAGSGPITDQRTAKQLMTMATASFLNDAQQHMKSIGDLNGYKSVSELSNVIGPLAKQYELPGFKVDGTGMGIEGGDGLPFKAQMSFGPGAHGSAPPQVLDWNKLPRRKK